MVTLFLDRGAAIDAQNLEGSTALFQAAEKGRLPVVKLLVERGANVAFQAAAALPPVSSRLYGQRADYRTLDGEGRRRQDPDKTGKAAIVYAAGRGFSPVVRLCSTTASTSTRAMATI